ELALAEAAHRVALVEALDQSRDASAQLQGEVGGRGVRQLQDVVDRRRTARAEQGFSFTHRVPSVSTAVSVPLPAFGAGLGEEESMRTISSNWSILACMRTEMSVTSPMIRPRL